MKDYSLYSADLVPMFHEDPNIITKKKTLHDLYDFKTDTRITAN